MDNLILPCTENQKLLESVLACLERLAELAHETQAALEQGDIVLADALDKDIENQLGEKERALGAYKYHREDHGC